MFEFINKFRKRTLFFVLLAIVLVISYAFTPIDNYRHSEIQPIGDLEVAFIDVGQGSSVMMKTADDKVILFDGGESDVYDTHLKPFLESQGIEKIDTAIVSHYHSDHMGGIGELLKDGRIKRLILPDYSVENDDTEFWEKYARKTNTQIASISLGGTIDCGYPGLIVNVLNPPEDGIPGESYHNENSMVLQVIYGKTSIMLTGDIEKTAEAAICKLGRNITCDILQIPHHGSTTSTSNRFLEKTDPTYAVIQSGAGNRYGHPHYEILNKLEDTDVTVYRNDTDGHIIFTISPTDITGTSLVKPE